MALKNWCPIYLWVLMDAISSSTRRNISLQAKASRLPSDVEIKKEPGLASVKIIGQLCGDFRHIFDILQRAVYVIQFDHDWLPVLRFMLAA
jgi:hypothetical protein